MAKIRAGILSKLTGKVAGVVGGTWKNVNYLREYVIPANPQTAAQTTQRNKFSAVVDFCKPLVGPIFNVYTDKFQKAMSGYNFFIKRNIAIFTPTPVLTSVKVTEGKLFMGAISNRVASESLDTVVFNTGVGLGSNGDPLDLIFAAAYNENKNLWGFLASFYNREDGNTLHTINLDIDTGDNIVLYAWASQYIGTVLDIISDSVVDEGTA